MFCAEIARQTSDHHRAAESSPFIRDLLAGRLQARAHADLMCALAPVYAALEGCVRDNSDDASVSLFDHRRLDRSERIAADLAQCGRRVPRDPTLPAVSDYVCVIESSATSPQRLLAHHYTRYRGDMAGGQVIASMLRRHYGVGPEALTFYDFSDLGDTVHYRRRYKTLLDLVPWSPSEQAEFIAECQVAFMCNAEVFGQLGEHVGATPSGAHGAGGFLRRERQHLPT
ncbi:MAG: biliverdin-producing heme oxygenase [Actinomycetota bacterium]|nr:biliverdin-producing heme oxygenase [Actinomycetota bacterium]